MNTNNIILKILFLAFDILDYYFFKLAKFEDISIDLLKPYCIIAIIFIILFFLTLLFIYIFIC